MSWNVKFRNKTARDLRRLPSFVQNLVEELVEDIKATGPIRADWPNYSRLNDGSFHCHLNYSYVAVWIVVDQEVKVIEVNYVGSRENAPY